MHAFFGGRSKSKSQEIGLDLWDNSPSLGKSHPEPVVTPAQPMSQASLVEGGSRVETLLPPAAVAVSNEAPKCRRPRQGGRSDSSSRKRGAARAEKAVLPQKTPTTVESDNIYVQYLPLEATETDLRELFANIGVVRSCRIVMDFEKKRSKGYGFVLMGTCSDASRAVEALNGISYRGKRLLVRLADHSPTAPWPTEAAGCESATSCSKQRAMPTVSDQLYVKGLPRWWREGEIRDFFSTHGVVKSVKLLLEDTDTGCVGDLETFTNSNDSAQKGKSFRLSKGIALVRFGDSAEAKRALAVSGTSPDRSCSDPLILRYAYDPTAARDHNESRRRELTRLSQTAKFGPSSPPGSDSGPAGAQSALLGGLLTGPAFAGPPEGEYAHGGRAGAAAPVSQKHDPYYQPSRFVDPLGFGLRHHSAPHMQQSHLHVAGNVLPGRNPHSHLLSGSASTGVVGPVPNFYHSPSDYFDAFLDEGYPANSRQSSDAMLRLSSGQSRQSGFPSERSESDVAQEAAYYAHAPVYAAPSVYSADPSARYYYDEPIDLLLHYRRHPYGPPVNDLEVVVHQRAKKQDPKPEARAVDDALQQERRATAPRSIPDSTSAECPYCSTTTSVLISGVPMDPSECQDVVMTLLGAFEETLTISCLGTGDALVSFQDRWNAMNAVQCMQYPPYNVRFACCHVQA